ncbi:hypothetical protein [Candidatus Frankia nodulisporulans]|uniref:hypothetical protein n=1 Tax=Candidatus Frankia nodulisporulans TaxID=2060052 RepID=UPI0013D3F707|nr:hypothetical protein [Candidatus Frankia nodulisporulans]
MTEDTTLQTWIETTSGRVDGWSLLAVLADTLGLADTAPPRVAPDSHDIETMALSGPSETGSTVQVLVTPALDGGAAVLLLSRDVTDTAAETWLHDTLLTRVGGWLDARDVRWRSRQPECCAPQSWHCGWWAAGGHRSPQPTQPDPAPLWRRRLALVVDWALFHAAAVLLLLAVAGLLVHLVGPDRAGVNVAWLETLLWRTGTGGHAMALVGEAVLARRAADVLTALLDPADPDEWPRRWWARGSRRGPRRRPGGAAGRRGGAAGRGVAGMTSIALADPVSPVSEVSERVGVLERMTPEQAHPLGVMLDRALWLVTALVCTYSLVNVHGVAVHHGTGDPQAWLLAPIVDIALIAAIRADSALSTAGAPPGPWAAGLRWFAGLSTWTLNVWDALFPLPLHGAHGEVLHDAHGAVLHGHIDPGAVVSHSVPPVILILLAEAAVAYRRAVARLAAQGQAADDALRQAHDDRVAAEADRDRVAGELETTRAAHRQLAGALTETAGELEAARAQTTGQLAAARAETVTAAAARDQALAALAETAAEGERLAADLAEAAEQSGRARAAQTAVLGELGDARAEGERLSRDLADTTAALSQTRTDLDAALSRESSRAAAARAAGKDAQKGGGLSGWTGEATAGELTVLAAVLESVQLRRTGRRLTYSAAQTALGVRYDAAKAALTAAREGVGDTPMILPVFSPVDDDATSDSDIADADILPAPSPTGPRALASGGTAGGR